MTERLNWQDVLHMAEHGTPAPSKQVKKTIAEWKGILSDDVFRITREHSTERPFSGNYCEAQQAGQYACICCQAPLFDSRVKFNSDSGWPSFHQPIARNAIKYSRDSSFGADRIESLCNTCDAHLGHVFQDGPEPSGLRYCINSAALELLEGNSIEIATLGGGCFWCIEAGLQQLTGISQIKSGYSGGSVDSPDYRSISAGNTGHAEVVQVSFDPGVLSYQQLLKAFFVLHDPTQLNAQGEDKGTQYRSVVLYHSQRQLVTAKTVIANIQELFEQTIVTELSPFNKFFKASIDHQNYYNDNSEQAYCQVVISPKLQKLRNELKQGLLTN